MVKLITAATATVAVILATSAYAEPVANIEGTDIDISARSEHGHAHGAHHHHHATPSRRDLGDVEDLDARFSRIATRKEFGREFDELDEVEARDLEDGEELEARHEHSHLRLHEHVKRALEEMSDEELQARAPIFRRLKRIITTRDLSDEELEARAPLFFLPKIAKKIFGRELEEDLEARGLMLPGRRYPTGWKGMVRPRELDEDLEARGLVRPGRRYPVGWKGMVRARELEEHLEARGLMLPGRRYPAGWRGAARPRELEEDLEARGLMRPGKRYPAVWRSAARPAPRVEARGLTRPGKRYPVGWKGMVRARELEAEDSVAARSLEELD